MMEQQKVVVSSRGSLARAIANAPKRVNLATMSGPEVARSLMLAQLPVYSPIKTPGSIRSNKKNSRERRLAKINAGALKVTADGKLVGA